MTRGGNEADSPGKMNIIRIDRLDLQELDVYARHSEVQLKRYYEPAPGLFIAESPKVIQRALEAGYEPVSVLAEERMLETAEALFGSKSGSEPGSKSCSESGSESCIPVYTAGEHVLTKLTGYYLTSGMLSVFRRKKLLNLEGLLEQAAGIRGREIRRIAVLEHVVNPTNLGAIVRSAAALGMDAVLFTPDCCDPLYRRAIRVSMGNIFLIPWTFTGSDPEAWYRDGIRTLKRLGFFTAAMALRNHSAAVDDPVFARQEKLAVILGTEGEGLRDSTIRDCDSTIMIPMTHGVDSLNVGAAAAISFWHLGKRQSS